MTNRGCSRRLSIAALVVGLGVVLLLGPMAPAASAATPAPTLDATFSSLLNTLRSTLGLGTLSVDSELSSVARSWSVQMASSGSLAHNDSLRSQVSGWERLGENVGYGPGVTNIFNALVASPGHMRNMSDPAYTRIGVGTVTDARGLVWTTHVFMRPGGAVAARPAPAAPATAAPAPATTRAPRPTPTTAAPATVPPTTAAPATVPVATTAPPAPVEVAAADRATPVEQTSADPLLASTNPAPQPGLPTPVLGGAALLGLLVLGGTGFLLRRRTIGADRSR